MSIPSCSWIFWRKVNFQNKTKITRRGKHLFLSITFFLLPSIISKFDMQSWFDIIFIRYNQEFLLSSSFWENTTVTTCPYKKLQLDPVSPTDPDIRHNEIDCNVKIINVDVPQIPSPCISPPIRVSVHAYVNRIIIIIITYSYRHCRYHWKISTGTVGLTKRPRLRKVS